MVQKTPNTKQWNETNQDYDCVAKQKQIQMAEANTEANTEAIAIGGGGGVVGLGEVLFSTRQMKKIKSVLKKCINSYPMRLFLPLHLEF